MLNSVVQLRPLARSQDALPLHTTGGERSFPLPAASDMMPLQAAADSRTEYREVFQDFVGQTFYQQMLKAMRATVDKPAYFHGGRTEEVFQAQLDQVLAEQMADASGQDFTGPMFDLMTLPRR